MKTDGKGQKTYDFIHTWNVRQKENRKKEANKQKQNKNLIDTGNRLVVTKGEGIWGENEMVKRSQIYGGRWKLDF